MTIGCLLSPKMYTHTPQGYAMKEIKEIVFVVKQTMYFGSKWNMSQTAVHSGDCTARQCSPLRRKFMGCSINNPALSLLMKHLAIGQR